MKITIRHKPLFFTFIILAGVGSISYFIYKSIQKLLDSAQWVEHTEQVIYQSANILSLEKDIETSSRGFVITKDSLFLKPLYLAEKKIFVNIGQLRQLTEDNPAQQGRIDSLNFYVDKSLNFSQQLVELRNKEGLASAIAYTSTKEGQQYSMNILRVTDSIQQEEGNLLKERKQTNQRSVAAFNRISFVLFILIVVFTIILLNAARNYLNQNKDKEKRAAELIIANKELAFQNEEKEKRAAELIIANKELLFQNEEKEKRAAELIIANKELLFQNAEKEKRAAELTIANREFAFQNEEKEKRAAELIIANKELAFQNEEKEKRAAELIIANKELAFQNEEKEKRAAELIIANKELAFQNEEKEKRAAELFIANKELAFQNEEKEKRAAELIIVNKELTKAEDDIRKLNTGLELRVIQRTSQLETANKELESFSYSVSHDLRAPIRAINGYSQILEEDYYEKLDADGIKVLHSIMYNSKKMGSLIDDLLAFSKLGRKHVTLSEINMNELVNLIIEDQVPEESENKPEFNETLLPRAMGDPSLIKQVWINLISNAIKYSKNKPKTLIETGAYEKDGQIVYFIKDNGAGFDMQYYDKLFGVFQRLHSQDEFEGTGIGLAIVQKIVTRHNGTVWAESKPDEGTCFYFSLPAIHS